MKKRASLNERPARLHDEEHSNTTPPIVTGQNAQVLNLIREHGPILSFTLTADFAIPQAYARINYLRGRGFNIITEILPEVEYRGRIRTNIARYSLGSPEWGPIDAL